MENLLLIACVLAIVSWWIVLPLRTVLHERKLEALSAAPYVEPANWPLVSVLVPARNEQDSLADAVQSLLEVDYPALEIVIIDDRSDDSTGDIAERLAQRDARIRTLHIESLPEGWLGKVHAMHRGIAMSNGEWLLFTDADIHFSRAVLKRAIAHCLRRERDFLTLFPGFVDTGLVIAATQTAFGVILLSLLDFDRIARPDNPMAIGIGAFNLARRSYIDADQGLEWLRMEVADDAGIALMMKQRGAAMDVLSGHGLVEVDWYPTLTAIMDGVVQRFVMGANYRLGFYCLQCLAFVFCLLAPIIVSVLLSSVTPLAWLGLAAFALPSLIIAAGLRGHTIALGPLMALPLGYTVIAYGMLRSVVTYLRRGGLYWRGTVYPLRELRASQRVRMKAFF
ncbi:MAG: glycosyltransferase [Gammaproteobacteria bacterium]|nr:glycosyltransferase [Gammaproteobacteria bacterium]